MPVNIDIVTGTLMVGTTAISGGSSGRVLYNNGGTLGEMTTTGSGTVLALATGPTFPTSVTIGAAAGATGTVLLKGTTSGTVTLSTADAAGTWTLKLPTSAGSSGQFLKTDGSGNTSWDAAGGGLTVGTTTITSGTSGRILYNNGGVLGEATVTGTLGSVVLSESPTIVTPAITTTATLTRTSIGATSTDGLILTNTTAATAGAQQYSPRLRLTGQGWKTNATAASQTVDWIIENQPVQGAANPTTNLVIASQTNAGGYSQYVSLTNYGALSVTSGATAQCIVGNGGNNTSFPGIWFLTASPDFTNYSFLKQSSATILNDGTRLVFRLANNTKMEIDTLNGELLTLASGVGLGFSSGSSTPVTSADVRLIRDAAANLALRNGTNAQAFRVYNTHTSSTNYELAGLFWSSNVFHVGADKGSGGGTARVLQIDYGGTTTAAISVPITSGQVTFGGGFVSGGTGTFGANYNQYSEMTAPSAPATNSVRIYAEDNGAGKTRLMALFATGAAQQIAIEP